MQHSDNAIHIKVHNHSYSLKKKKTHTIKKICLPNSRKMFANQERMRKTKREEEHERKLEDMLFLLSSQIGRSQWESRMWLMTTHGEEFGRVMFQRTLNILIYAIPTTKPQRIPQLKSAIIDDY